MVLQHQACNPEFTLITTVVAKNLNSPAKTQPLLTALEVLSGGTFNTKAIFYSALYPIAYEVIKGFQNKAIYELDIFDKQAKSIE